MGTSPICCENLSENSLKGRPSECYHFQPTSSHWSLPLKLSLFIRQDLAGGRVLAQLSAEKHLELAGLAIRAEFGEFIDLIHGGGDYFSLHHYLPEAGRSGGIHPANEGPGG